MFDLKIEFIEIQNRIRIGVIWMNVENAAKWSDFLFVYLMHKDLFMVHTTTSNSSNMEL